MKKFKKYSKKNKFNPYVIFSIIIIGIVLMSVGYAISNDSLTINGFANARYQIYTIEYELNGGRNPENPITEFTIQDEYILPIPVRDNYTFSGWYTNEDFIGDSVATTKSLKNSVTLYAKWTGISDKDSYTCDEVILDGSNYINTGIKPYSAENIDKNYEISFEIDEVGENINLNALMNCMYEVNPFPGVVFRIGEGGNIFYYTATGISKGTYNISAVHKVSFKRYNDSLYLKLNDGKYTKLGTYENKTIFDVPVTFGASLNSAGEPFRYFVGKLSNVSVKLSDPVTYTIKFDANGGTGSMSDQIVKCDKTTTLSANLFQNSDYLFNGWNTKADGTGTSYVDKQQIKDLADENGTVTLYAQWLNTDSYNVIYVANGGTGTMKNQTIDFGATEYLSRNQFTKEGYVFAKWNTKADGTGTSYIDKQSIKNLTTTPGENIILYAIWGSEAYSYAGDYVFDGSNYINTGIYLYSNENANKDFEISFNISNTTFVKQGTILNARDESGSPCPGFVIRCNNASKYEIVTTGFGKKKFSISSTTKISIKKVNNTIYYSINDGNYSKIGTYSSYTNFDVPTTLGASLDGSRNPFRYYKGTLSNISIVVY